MAEYLINFDVTIPIRLLVSVIFGGVIGWERSGTNHDAGLKTHIIVCLGAASIMVVSECIVKQYGINSEIMRMGAQIVSGVGFLGAGSIIIDGNRIRGITTAAGIWTTACVGIVVGAGYYLIAGFVVVLMLFTMYGLRKVAHRRNKTAEVYSFKYVLESKNMLKDLLIQLNLMNIAIKNVKTAVADDGAVSVVISMVIPDEIDISTVVIETSTCDGVSELVIM